MDIVFCTDTKYVMPSGVLMKSISVNNADDEIHFHAIIDESVTESDKKALSQCLSKKQDIAFYTVCGTDYENFPNLDVSPEYAAKHHITATHTTKACYYRLSMARLNSNVGKEVLLPSRSLRNQVTHDFYCEDWITIE